MKNKIFEINNNLLSYKFINPSIKDLLEISSKDILWGIPVVIDHITLTVESKLAFDKYINDFKDSDCRIIKNPGIYPYDYCEVEDDFNVDLAMHFCAILLKKVKIILVAPVSDYDATSNFIKNRGLNAIHHLGVETNNLENEIKLWENIEFEQLSNIVEDEGLVQIFLKNKEGQIIELLQRLNINQETFTCENAKNLRISEN